MTMGSSCEEACAALLPCDLDDAPMTEEECLMGCTEAMGEDPSFQSTVECAITHLGDNMCDELAFYSCVNPTIGFFSVLSEALCTKVFECCPEGNPIFDNQQECQGFISGFAGSMALQDIEDGWLEFDEAKAQDCMAELQASFAALTCDEVSFSDDLGLTDVSACDGILNGLVEEGGVCGRASEDDGGVMTSDGACAGDLICGPYDGENLPVCVQPVAEGEACDLFETAECVEGATCVNQVCVATLASGEMCESDEACDSQTCIDGVCSTENNICGE
jgi:hypothetical protein